MHEIIEEVYCATRRLSPVFRDIRFKYVFMTHELFLLLNEADRTVVSQFRHEFQRLFCELTYFSEERFAALFDIIIHRITKHNIVWEHKHSYKQSKTYRQWILELNTVQEQPIHTVAAKDKWLDWFRSQNPNS